MSANLKAAMRDTAFYNAADIASARLIARRLRAAIRSTTFPKSALVSLAHSLNATRSHGTCYGLADWLYRYGPMLESELATAVRWRYRKPAIAMVPWRVA